MSSVYDKYKEYHDKFRAMGAGKRNEITLAVNCKVPKKDAGLEDEVEIKYYDYLEEEASAWEKRGGVRPVFDMEEIESDDPRLDIYKDPV